MRYDGPLFYLAKKRAELAERSYESIYYAQDDGGFQRICHNFQKTQKMTNSTKVSLADAFLYDENFKRASWVNVINIVFHELAGINVILQYSNTILGIIFAE